MVPYPKWGSCRCNDVRQSTPSSSMTHAHVKSRDLGTDTHIQWECHVKIKEEIGVVPYKARNAMTLPANHQMPGESHRIDPFLTAFRRSVPTPWVQISSFWNCETICTSVVSAMCTFSWKPTSMNIAPWSLVSPGSFVSPHNALCMPVPLLLLYVRIPKSFVLGLLTQHTSPSDSPSLCYFLLAPKPLSCFRYMCVYTCRQAHTHTHACVHMHTLVNSKVWVFFLKLFIYLAVPNKLKKYSLV